MTIDNKKKKYILFIILLAMFILLKGFELYGILASSINTVHYATLACDFIPKAKQ
jgi:uncharacterized membrane protein